MIQIEDAQQSVALANIVGERDLGIRAKAETPLDILTKASYGANVLDSNNDPLYQLQTISAASQNENYESKFDEVVGTVATAVKAHLSFARNVVSPVIASMAACVAKAIEDKVANRSSDFDIVVLDLPAPLSNEALISTVKREATGTSLLPEDTLKLPKMTKEQLVDLMVTGSSQFDEQVRSWISSKPENYFVSTIWNNVFCVIPDEENFAPVLSFGTLVNDRVGGADAALAIYLLTQRLEDEVPEGSTMPLNTYTTLIRQYRAAAIEALARVIEAQETRVRTGTMVLSMQADKRRVEVSGDVYRNWLTAGGAPELLAGMAVTNNINYTTAAIDERKDELSTEWTKFASIQETLARNNAFNYMLDALKECFVKDMANPFEQESEMFASSSYVEKANELFKEELKSVSITDMEDLNNVCMRLVCRSRFYYTDSEKILTSMKQAAAANPNITAREAALVATIEYVSDYVADMMEVY